jgi:hypothetical protein
MLGYNDIDLTGLDGAKQRLKAGPPEHRRARNTRVLELEPDSPVTRLSRRELAVFSLLIHVGLVAL